MRVFLILFAAAAGFAALEGFLFHSDLYPRLVAVDSSTGVFENYFNNERQRKLEGPQILAVGDSRMSLVPRVADNMHTGYTLASVGCPGTTPRTWYYMLRDLDPGRNRYRAIVFAVDNYDDQGAYDDFTDRVLDLRLAGARLGLRDLWDFSSTYRTWNTQLAVARSILFKGSLWSVDIQNFLHNPAERKRTTDMVREGSHSWIYDFVAPKDTMEEVSVDFVKKTMKAPGRHEAKRDDYRQRFLDEIPKDDGKMSDFNHKWFGRIHDLYAGSRTRLVFFRVPRAPFIRPDYPEMNPAGTLRHIPGAVLLREDLLNELEKPQFFMDAMHLNESGRERVTHLVVPQVIAAIE